MSRPEPAGDESLNRLAGQWRIFQLKRGHRFSTDDLMTAWTAAHAAPDATRVLDIGSGIGSVGLLTLWRLQQRGVSAELTSVEVQQISWALMQKTVAWNGLEPRVDSRCGDLRDERMTAGLSLFPLITGSPPYIPADKGVQSPHPQKAAARIELHGSITDYCTTAARLLAPEGRFCFVHAAADERPEAAVEAAGLKVIARRDVKFRHDQPPLIALFTCAFSGDRADPPIFTIRNAEGRWTEEYLAMRQDMGTKVWNREPRTE